MLAGAGTVAAVPASSARVVVGIGAPVATHAPGPVCNPYSPYYDPYYCGYGPAYVGGPVVEFGSGGWHGGGLHGGNFDGVGFHGGHRQSPILTTKGSVHRSGFL